MILETHDLNGSVFGLRFSLMIPKMIPELPAYWFIDNYAGTHGQCGKLLILLLLRFFEVINVHLLIVVLSHTESKSKVVL